MDLAVDNHQYWFQPITESSHVPVFLRIMTCFCALCYIRNELNVAWPHELNASGRNFSMLMIFFVQTLHLDVNPIWCINPVEPSRVPIIMFLVCAQYLLWRLRKYLMVLWKWVPQPAPIDWGWALGTWSDWLPSQSTPNWSQGNMMLTYNNCLTFWTIFPYKSFSILSVVLTFIPYFYQYHIR